MTNDQQKEILTDLCNNIRDRLLNNSNAWPEEWDGHELRELLYKAVEYERSPGFRDQRLRRAREFKNIWIISRLY